MRPDHTSYFLAIAAVVATRSTCARRSVGCVLVDASHRIISTGYNGVARDQPHCLDGAARCPAADAESGTRLDGCHAIHAEQNALLQCRSGTEAVHTCYVTHAPCVTCTKLLLNTGCVAIVAAHGYAHMEDSYSLWCGNNASLRYMGKPQRTLTVLAP